MEDKIHQFDVYVERLITKIIDFLPSLISALLILIIGIWVIKFIKKLVRRFFTRRHPDATLENFISSLVDWALKILLFVLVVTQLGVESASLVAMIGAAGYYAYLRGDIADFSLNPEPGLDLE